MKSYSREFKDSEFLLGFWLFGEMTVFIRPWTWTLQDTASALRIRVSYLPPLPHQYLIIYSISISVGNSLDSINWIKITELEILYASQHARKYVPWYLRLVELFRIKGDVLNEINIENTTLSPFFLSHYLWALDCCKILPPALNRQHAHLF